MDNLNDNFKDLKLAIFDLDGVIYHGKKLIPNVDKVIRKLKDFSIVVKYNSNNSTITREMYVEKLEKMNIASEISDFYTSASITSQMISEIKNNANIFVIGEKGLKEELEAKGHTIIEDSSQNVNIDFVIVGLDRNFTYQKLAKAQYCILEKGAKFYATNADSTLPGKDRLLPGAGTMVNALKTCTSKDPLKIFGKPEPTGVKSILRDTKIDKRNTFFFGDRLDTDILAGNKIGINTVLVLTGVTTKTQIDNLRHKKQESRKINEDLLPDHILNSLVEIFKN
ncbi:MAG: putative hydrolase YutF [Promethearchaeota archaeon]|nr:MAG: putative hydrolase YutF [Candidatus Lokiarchaeota archaeon]